MHDDGTPVGISDIHMFETLMVLFHIAEKIGATIQLMETYLGKEYDDEQENYVYVVKLRVTQPWEDFVDPDMFNFTHNLQFFDTSRMAVSKPAPSQSNLSAAATKLDPVELKP